MEQYRTEEEQVEALKKWWDENGRSTIVAIIVALGLGFGWQGWQKHQTGETELASERYQALLQEMSAVEQGGAELAAIELAGQIKTDHSRTTYAQFAGLHLAQLAVMRDDMAEAESQLRWVLGRADKGSDVHQLAQLRLARVLASGGDAEQALTIIESAEPGNYQAAYAVAKGDTLLQLERTDEARAAYSQAMILASRGEGGQINLALVQQKLQSLSQAAPREIAAADAVEVVTEASQEVAPAEE